MEPNTPTPATTPVGPTREKRILIFSTVYYPSAVVGAVRMTEWCRHLPQHGYRPIVACRYYGAFADKQELAQNVHPSVLIKYLDAPESTPRRGGGAFSPLTLARRMASPSIHRAARLIAVPDAARLFWRAIRQRALTLVDELSPDLILTTGPPHSNHDIGLFLSKERPHIPWIADFRDPYCADKRFGRTAAPGLRLAHHCYEKSIYQRASLVVHANPAHARWARVVYGDKHQRSRVLMNGCNDELIRQLEARAEVGQIQAQKPRRRTIVYMGDEALKPPLVAACQALLKQGENIQIKLVGARGSMFAQPNLSQSGSIEHTGQLSHQDALGHLVDAEVLVAGLSPERASGSGISSKLFEYLVCGKPIIIINPTRMDRVLTRSVPGVRCLHRPTPEALIDALRWGLSPEAIPNPSQAQVYRRDLARSAQVTLLAGWLDDLLLEAGSSELAPNGTSRKPSPTG